MDEASFWVSTEKDGSWSDGGKLSIILLSALQSDALEGYVQTLLHFYLCFYTCTSLENCSLYAYTFFTGSGNTVATWCKELTQWKRPCCGERLKARKEGGDKTEDEMVGWHHWLNGYEFEQTPSDSEGQKPGVLQFMGVARSWTWLSNWTTTILTSIVLGSNTLLHL